MLWCCLLIGQLYHDAGDVNFRPILLNNEKSAGQDSDLINMGLHQCISADFNGATPDLHQ